MGSYYLTTIGVTGWGFLKGETKLMTYVERVLWVVGLSKGWSFEVVIELKSYEVIGKRYAWEVT